MLLDKIRNTTSEFTEDEKSIFAMIHAFSLQKASPFKSENSINLDIEEHAKRNGITKLESFNRLLKAVDRLFERSFAYSEVLECGALAHCLTRWIPQYKHSMDEEMEDPYIKVYASPFLIEHIDYIGQYVESYILKDIN